MELGVDTTGHTCWKQLVAATEVGQVRATTLALTVALATLTLTVTLPLSTTLTLAFAPTTRLLGEHLRVRNVAIEASDLCLHAGRLIQQKTVSVLKRSHASALERRLVRVGRAVASPSGLLLSVASGLLST